MIRMLPLSVAALFNSAAMNAILCLLHALAAVSVYQSQEQAVL